ncbi:MAG: hypothetical protein JWR78_2554 [Mycobacterium sp.]|jgi:hypothetical protein|nr:hypothetical protein [Mycobacterium sp.]
MGTATVVATFLLAALFAFAGSIKVLGVPQSLAIREHLGIAAAVGVALLSVGAVASHVRASDGAGQSVPAAIGLVLAVATAVLHIV